MIRVGTRDSRLSIAQTDQLIDELQKKTGKVFSKVLIKTIGDKNLQDRFDKIGAKGVFTKELDEALLRNEVDIAIHSLKDLPTQFPTGVRLVGISPCIDPRDAWISNQYKTIEDVPEDGIIGTSSVRRVSQIKRIKPNIRIYPLRGNVIRRLEKLDEEKLDGIILATSGLIRMSLEEKITSNLSLDQFVPAIGQGYLAITAAKDCPWIATWQDTEVWEEAHSLRELMQKLGGGCSIPLGAVWRAIDQKRTCQAFVSDPEGRQNIQESMVFDQTFGNTTNLLFDKLVQSGAVQLLKGLKHG